MEKNEQGINRDEINKKSYAQAVAEGDIERQREIEAKAEFGHQIRLM